jgi:hypothetical protein
MPIRVQIAYHRKRALDDIMENRRRLLDPAAEHDPSRDPDVARRDQAQPGPAAEAQSVARHGRRTREGLNMETLTFVLVLWSAWYSEPITTIQGYRDQAACERAAQAARDEMKKQNSRVAYHVFCIPGPEHRP